MASSYERLQSVAHKLIAEWRAQAMADVPPEYADRDLHRKYLNGDVWAGGLRDCADDLEAALAQEADIHDRRKATADLLKAKKAWRRGGSKR